MSTPIIASADTRQTVDYLNAMQKFLREETRLGIPALGIGEGLHGYMAHEATSFPQAIGLASAWDPDLHERVFGVVAREMRARGAHYVLSPVLDLARDPRWGRTEETYGEDPYLVSRLGVAAVHGLQGERFTGDPEHVLATAKHFAAHGQPEAGTNCRSSQLRGADVARGILRALRSRGTRGKDRHGDGFVQRDQRRALACQLLAAERSAARGMGLRRLCRFPMAGAWTICIACTLSQRMKRMRPKKPSPAVWRWNWGTVSGTWNRRSRQDASPKTLLDAAVAKVLRVKFQLGLFENPFVDEETAVAVTNCAEHKALALEAAHKTMILLKNEGGLLPLDKSKLRSLAVIGPNAAPIRLGGYSGNPGCAVSVLEGIRQKAGETIEVLYAEGCGLTQSTNDTGQMWHDDEVLPPDPAHDAALIAEAVQTAQKADSGPAGAGR